MAYKGEVNGKLKCNAVIHSLLCSTESEGGREREREREREVLNVLGGAHATDKNSPAVFLTKSARSL